MDEFAGGAVDLGLTRVATRRVDEYQPAVQVLPHALRIVNVGDEVLRPVLHCDRAELLHGGGRYERRAFRRLPLPNCGHLEDVALRPHDRAGTCVALKSWVEAS